MLGIEVQFKTLSRSGTLTSEQVYVHTNNKHVHVYIHV